MEKDFFVHESAYIDEGCVIGKGTKIWHFSHIMTGSCLGQNCTIGQNVFISPKVILGNNVSIQNNVSIYEGVICEEDVFFGPSVVLTNVINPRSAVSRKEEYKTTIIKKGASIGANATIVCGNTLGAFCFIGAGAVVTKDVPDYALIVGNPGRQTGWMSEFGNRLTFNNDNFAICEGSGQTYVLENNIVKRIK